MDETIEDVEIKNNSDEDSDEDAPKVSKKVALLDSDEEEEADQETSVKKKVTLQDSDDEDEDVEKDDENGRKSDDGEKDNDETDDSGSKKKATKKKKHRKKSSNNSDDDEEESSEDSDDDEEDDGKEGSHKSEEQEESDQSEDESNRPRKLPNETIYDFDIMMAKKKEENSRKRKRRGYDIINDNDDIIADIIQQMKDAVEADNEANKSKQAATRKLKLLPFVISQLRKVDLRDAFLDSDVLSVITEWLAPLPDRSLPHLAIREDLLKILIDFNLSDVDRIKSSGIGKAIMYLYKHPKETRENKQRAKQLISCWSRPIFQLDSSFSAISREEREQRDLELMSKQRRASRNDDSSDGEGPGTSSGSKKPKEEPVAQKPGEKGWIPRARVPAPSMKDYVIRPRSKVDGDIGKSSKRPSNMLEKYMKNQQERKRAGRQQRAVNMKIDRI